MLAMAAECTQETILAFLLERGGKVRNMDLIEHFKAVFPEEPERRAAVRETFKQHVDSLAFVKSESGVKHVCLRKKFRAALNDKLSVNNRTEVTDSTDAARYRERAAGAAPGSGYGNDSQVRVPHNFSAGDSLQDKAGEDSRSPEFVCTVEDVDSTSGDMGNWESSRRETRGSRKEQTGNAPHIPEITVIEASPLPAEGRVFSLPGPAHTGRTGQVDSAVGLSPIHTQGGAISPADSSQPETLEDEDNNSLSGSEDSCTPKGSRKHFIQVMMNSSPEVRRSIVRRSSVYPPSKNDTESVASSNLEEDRAPVTLDPVEHEWMMCASDGEWDSLHRLVIADPGLILRKDFVTGFSCLHWAAKHGNPELIARIINFAKQQEIPISVDVRSNTGYTPLHIAAMHSHMEVVKLLVGAYNADVEIRDYSGRKACQYLTDDVSMDIRDIIGAYERSEAENSDPRAKKRWRISKVLQSNLKPLRLLNPSACDSVDGESPPREKPLRRKSSLSKMKPKLQKLRFRSSQIVHSTSFNGKEEQEGSQEGSKEGPKKGSFRFRPKSHFFG